MGNISKWKDIVWNQNSNSFEEMKIDDYGRWMKYSEFGNRPHDYSWEIDHLLGKNEGGADHPSNFRPLNWRSNVERNGKKYKQNEVG